MLKKHIYWIKKFTARPRFEDDETIVTAFTEYSQAQEKIKRLRRELSAWQTL